MNSPLYVFTLDGFSWDCARAMVHRFGRTIHWVNLNDDYAELHLRDVCREAGTITTRERCCWHRDDIADRFKVSLDSVRWHSPPESARTLPKYKQLTIPGVL